MHSDTFYTALGVIVVLLAVGAYCLLRWRMRLKRKAALAAEERMRGTWPAPPMTGRVEPHLRPSAEILKLPEPKPKVVRPVVEAKPARKVVGENRNVMDKPSGSSSSFDAVAGGWATVLPAAVLLNEPFSIVPQADPLEKVATVAVDPLPEEAWVTQPLEPDAPEASAAPEREAPAEADTDTDADSDSDD